MAAPDPDPRPRVALVFGGHSSEHQISCLSAGSILAAIDRRRYRVVAVGITRSGSWQLVSDDPDDYRIVDGELPAIMGNDRPVLLSADPAVGGLIDAAGRRIAIDVVFPVLHGAYGEDGTIQGLCELAGLPFVGSGVAASAICMDKILTKDLLGGAGIPIGAYLGVTDRQWRHSREDVLRRALEMGLPLFVKPARAGSSVGISKVSVAGDLAAAIDAARDHDPRVIIEAAITGGREIECGVLAGTGGDPPQISACAEIEVLGPHEFYDFEAKYLDGSARITVPAVLDDGIRDRIEMIALRAFDTLGCEGMARIDMFVTADGSVLVNEPNTIPGFTATSMYPVVWAAAGVAYPDLLDRLLQDAIGRSGTGPS